MESFQWLKDLFTVTDSVAHIALLYAIVIAMGVYLGKIKIGGVSLGVTFVLFAGIIAGHIGFTAPTPILTFVQDFGLILFVFMIGMQVGPGFFESFGTLGIKLNGLAEGVRAGGKLAANVRKLKVRAPYTQIPERLEIDVTELGLGKTIKAGELKFEGLELITPASVVVCQVKMTRSAMSAAAKAQQQ